MTDGIRVVTPYWLEDVLQEQKLRPPWLAYHFPSPYNLNEKSPLTNHIISTHGFFGKEKLILKTIIWLLNGKYSSALTNINSFLISKSLDGIKVEKAKKLNIPIVNGIWLNELYLGNIYALNRTIDARYTQIDTVNHLTFASVHVADYMDQWKQLIKLPMDKIKEANSCDSSKELNINKHSPLKQLNGSTMKRHNRSLSNSPENENHSSKFVKKDSNNFSELAASTITWISRPQSSVPIVMFTGFEIKDVAVYQRDVICLGGVISNSFTLTTHLIVDKIERTAKLLKCISTCTFIIHIQWLIDSKLQGHYLDPLDYQINDEKFEKNFNCCLRESMARAKERNHPLFAVILIENFLFLLFSVF
jgi:PAX-interacting protein 1